MAQDNRAVEPGENAQDNSGVNRRNFLKCMAWAGTGLVWTFSAGGLLTACGDLTSTTAPAGESFTFIQISDTHIGFNTDGVNTNVAGTFQQAVDRINALPTRPALVLHTGDISHNSKPPELDMAYQILNTIKTDKFLTVPGEHDVLGDQGSAYRQRFQIGAGAKPWSSLDYKGVHFIALSNAGELDAFGLLGNEQLDWLKKDLAGLKKDVPLVIFAHVPLFTIYPQWGWETKDAGPALAMLKPFSNVTVLNGHIHQVMSQVEGNLHFYTASATAFPQHRPGVEKPNAYKLPANDLLRSIGYRTVNFIPGRPSPEISDTTLAGVPAETATVGPLVVSTAPANQTTQAPAGSSAATTGALVDAGPLTDFTDVATIPKSVSLKLSNTKPQETVFVVQSGSQYLALSDICTHQGCEVNWNQANKRFLCPCHGSEYDNLGKNLAGPAPRPLERYKTEVVNGRLMISTQRVTG